MKLTSKYIWDYNTDKMDLKNPDVLKWYLERKIQFCDWGVIDKETLKKYLSKLDIDPYIKVILRNFVKNGKSGKNIK